MILVIAIQRSLFHLENEILNEILFHRFKLFYKMMNGEVAQYSPYN